MTHFAADYRTTLCGLTYTSLLLKERAADCPACRAAHLAQGWTFPLPELAVTVDTTDHSGL